MAEESVKPGSPREPLQFVQRLAGSEAFRSLFKEGMALVEETADYLDGEGRGESRRLTRAGALSYATESMRLTTRLMQLASWLLLQRAVNDGELSNEQARVEKSKVKLGGLATATHGSGWESTAGKAEGADRPLASPSGAYPAARRCVRTRRPAGNRQPGPGTDGPDRSRLQPGVRVNNAPITPREAMPRRGSVAGGAGCRVDVGVAWSLTPDSTSGEAAAGKRREWSRPLIQAVMYFVLGLLTAGLIALALSPAVWRRAHRLAKARVESGLPMSLGEVQAEKDQLRATFAMSARRLELQVEDLKTTSSEQAIEASRHRGEIATLTADLGEKTTAIAALEARLGTARDELKAAEGRVEAVRAEVAGRDASLADRAQRIAGA